MSTLYRLPAMHTKVTAGHIPLQKQYKGVAAGKILLTDSEIRAITEKINNGTLQPPVHGANEFDFGAIKKKALWLVETGLSKSDHDHVMKALELLVRDNYYPGLEKDLYKCFESDHFLYDSDPYYRLVDIAALPGPVFTIVFFMEGVQALYLAARVKYIDRVVRLAPFIETAALKKKPGLHYLLEAVGVLDLYSAIAPGGTSISSRIPPPADIGGRLTTQDDITRTI